MKKWLRNKAKKVFGLYDIIDLTIGANCGCCGVYISGTIVPRYWRWDLCNYCANTVKIQKKEV